MLTNNQLIEMSQMQINKMDTSTLVDIGNVKIDQSLSAPARMLSYLAQIKNPYCFLCGKTPVKIEFTAGGSPLEDKLLSYFTGLKNR